MNITDIRVRKVLSDGVSTLDQQSQALLTKALDKLNKEELFNAPKIEQVDYETTYSVNAFYEFNEQYFTCAGISGGAHGLINCSASAVAPETWGVAMEVPFNSTYSPFKCVDRIPSPGATKSILRWDSENIEGASC
ncbi:hypothetical protein LSPH24S_08461 [Lysinibacillus sphaericus]